MPALDSNKHGESWSEDEVGLVQEAPSGFRQGGKPTVCTRQRKIILAAFVGVFLLALLIFSFSSGDPAIEVHDATRPPAPAAFHPGDKFRVAFNVQLEPDKSGQFVVEVYPEWAPRGAKQFLLLAENQFWSQNRIFRVALDSQTGERFVSQFGISGDPALNSKYEKLTIEDDPAKESNVRGTVVFAATKSPNSRSTQIFINNKDNTFLDPDFPPVGRVILGMDVVDSFKQVDPDNFQQSRYENEGNDYPDSFGW
eukprot:CAMPEP_0175146384 /NCGR_PEP_ID=MMETSP0087-20121206/15352_1 /TAXON_ID=136419 /ORGANISM="Unknown Unknown, Strain D1" /LENGTH=253 /DNA_ID=CAMNT_0016431347 /DNA_START=28 /DNA_END=786 /DNA_ORIENTATION=-